MITQCNQCHASLPPEASACPECGQTWAAPALEKAARPKPRPWAKKPFADAAVTEYIEIPPGGFPSPARPADPPPAPVAEKADRSAILVAVSLGLLAGLLVLLVIVGIASLRRAPKTPASAAMPHAASATPAR